MPVAPCLLSTARNDFNDDCSGSMDAGPVNVAATVALHKTQGTTAFSPAQLIHCYAYI